MSALNRDPLFGLYGTDELYRVKECLTWDRLECLHEDAPSTTRDNGLAFIDLQLDSIGLELARRKRLGGLPGAPTESHEPSADMRDYWKRIKDMALIPEFWARFFPAFPLRKSGHGWRGPCPLHGGKNETSMSIFAGGRRWHCFTCGEQGDIFALAGMVYQTTRFGEIADRLADEFGIIAPADLPEKCSQLPTPYRERELGNSSKQNKKLGFQPFERRNGELVKA